MGFAARPYTLTKSDIDSVLGYDVDAHEGRHASGGDDAIDADDLVEGADPRSSTHVSRHFSGGADPISPDSIDAADALHASRHASGGADPIAPDSIGAADALHASRHASGGDDQIDADALVAGADPQSTTALAAALAHASRHFSGGADPIAPDSIGAVATTGDEEIAGVKTFTSIPKGPASDPTDDDELARKAYVDAAGGAEAFRKPVNMATKYMIPGWYSFTYSQYAVYANYIIYIPIYVGSTMTFDRLCIQVTSPKAGKSMRLGIYEWSSEDVPGALILDAGTVSVASNGRKDLTINQELEGGRWYFLALAVETGGNATIRCLPNTVVPPVTGSSGDTNAPNSVLPAQSGAGDAVVAGGFPNPADPHTSRLSPEKGCAIWMRRV